jgi:hypothetical protein
MRYFYDFRSGSSLSEDEEGLELSDIEAAHKEAVKALGEAVKDVITEGIAEQRAAGRGARRVWTSARRVGRPSIEKFSESSSYFGGCKPGEFAHSSKGEAVSARRAFSSNSSCLGPGASSAAFSRADLANEASRSPRGIVGLRRRRFFMAFPCLTGVGEQRQKRSSAYPSRPFWFPLL